MKKFIFSLLLLIFTIVSYGQVGINTISPNANLDIRSSDQTTPSNTDGILIPVIDEFPTSAPGASQDGMLVFVSGIGTPAKGLYYWDNNTTSWTQFSSKSDIWDITGNSGTDGGTNNFIGTTDSQPLMFRTDNTNRLRIGTNGQLETLNTNQSVFIGENAGNVSTGLGNVLIGHNSGTATTSGQYNVFVGYETGPLNTTQSNNTFVGSFIGSAITSGSLNTYVGSGAGGVTTTGSNNTMVGLSTGQRNNTGERNTLMGRSAGIFNYAGSRNVYLGMNAGEGNFDVGEALSYSNNIFVGYEAGKNVAGSNNVFIGYQAGFSEGGSNLLYIENTNGATPLIGGNFSTNRVGINRSVGALTNTLEVGGTASKATAGAWLGNSDRRLKTNIHSISGNVALELVERMRGVTFEWNDEVTGMKRPDGNQMGFIAQELIEVFPDKVTVDNLGYYQTAYGDYDPIFVEAIKSLKNKLEEKDSQIRELSRRLEILEEMVINNSLVAEE